MAIFVEFYGVARRWAGVPNLRLELSGQQTTLGDVLQRLSDSAAASDGDVICRRGALHPTLSANLDGNRFISDPATPIHDGQCLLILSADAGG
jgi:molybdopterin converting factor small subunit